VGDLALSDATWTTCLYRSQAHLAPSQCTAYASPQLRGVQRQGLGYVGCATVALALGVQWHSVSDERQGAAYGDRPPFSILAASWDPNPSIRNPSSPFFAPAGGWPPPASLCDVVVGNCPQPRFPAGLGSQDFWWSATCFRVSAYATGRVQVHGVQGSMARRTVRAQRISVPLVACGHTPLVQT
jgi:hypothetical protein